MATPIEKLGHDAIEAKGWLGAHKWLLARRIVQCAILALFLSGPVTGYWILKGTISSSSLFDTVPMTDPLLVLQMLAAGFFTLASTALIGVGIVVALYLMVGGRAYCAWVCPMNVVTDIAHWLRRRFDIKSTMHLGRYSRYWVLAMVLIIAAATGTLAYELVNPVSVLYRGLIFGIGLGWAVVLGVFVFDLLVMKHGWCGHLCPMGATYGLIGRASLVRIRADHRERCDNCLECYVVCPEPHVISPALRGKEGSSTVIMSGDCTNCGRCIDICPEQVFNFGLRFKNAQRPQDWIMPAKHGAQT